MYCLNKKMLYCNCLIWHRGLRFLRVPAVSEQTCRYQASVICKIPYDVKEKPTTKLIKENAKDRIMAKGKESPVNVRNNLSGSFRLNNRIFIGFPIIIIINITVLISLFKGISTFVVYVMLKPSL